LNKPERAFTDTISSRVSNFQNPLAALTGNAYVAVSYHGILWEGQSRDYSEITWSHQM